MAEMSSVDRERLEHLERIVEDLYKRLVGQVIADIKALPENCRQSGDDSGLNDVWEEFKNQLQASVQSCSRPTNTPSKSCVCND